MPEGVNKTRVLWVQATLRATKGVVRQAAVIMVLLSGRFVTMLKRNAVLPIILVTCAAFAQTSSIGSHTGPNDKVNDKVNDKSWIEQSDRNTQMLLDVEKKYSPEQASRQGLAEYDKEIAVPTLANELAERKETEAVLAKLESAQAGERNKDVSEDLAILIKSTRHDFRLEDYELQHQVQFLNGTTYVYRGIQSLLDDQTAPERRQAAIIRLKKYAGLTEGYEPITTILQRRVESQMAKADVVYPSKQQMEVDLSRNPAIVAGIADLFRKYKLTGWEESYAKLKEKLSAYDRWNRENVLPKARTDFRLPPEQYAIALEGFGLNVPPEQLATKAHRAFDEIQAQMEPLARQIAQERHLPSSNYRDVMHALKKEQITGNAILPLYERHLSDIEQIIREHQLVTLPNRPAIIRLASAAETAQQPAPHMVPPPFLHNTGQRGVFVLPLNMPAAAGEKNPEKYDDFTFDAASWTLIAHEARPGHELQFDSMVEHGVSRARSLYAFNSTNAEGWGLYSESIVLPYMPLEGQLVSLDYRLLRAARAFLDPELQEGKIQPAEAMRVLTQDVVQSDAFAREEVERYTLKMPGQATSYFYGYTRLISLRKEAEEALGPRFNQLHFHDFLLSQGLLPPDLMRKAVMEDFVRAEGAAAAQQAAGNHP